MDNKQHSIKLISLVQSHPELWDLSHKHYSDIITKKYIWKDIALELELPVEEVKRKWDCLRAGCRRYLKRKESGGRCFKWLYPKELQFLEDQIKKVRQQRAPRFEKKVPKSVTYKKDRKLISCVKQWPILWDRNHEDYSSGEKRQIVWQTIAEELGASVEEIKLRWQRNYIRVKETSKMSPPLGDMAFLKGQVSSNHESVDESSSSSIPEIDSDAESISSEMEIKVESEEEQDKQKPADSSDESDFVEVDIYKLKNGVDSNMEASNQVESIDLKFKSNNCPEKGEGAKGVKQFFLSLAETVNTLPPLLQAKVKAEVFKSVNSAELACLEAGQSQF